MNPQEHKLDSLLRRFTDAGLTHANAMREVGYSPSYHHIIRQRTHDGQRLPVAFVERCEALLARLEE